MRYLAVNEEGKVVNIIIWDGVSKYNPKGLTLIAESSVPQGVSFNWTLNNGEWIEPVIVEQIEVIRN
jgi:hypothetical protein